MAGRNTEFFHGTSYDIPGGRVLPGSITGNSVWGDTGRDRGQPARDHAFATSDEQTAWTFADNARTADDLHGRTRTLRAGRARVYRVKPNKEMTAGVHTNFHEWIAPHFDIEDTIDIKPGQQGTFSQLNWNQFGHRDMSPWDDANHPTDKDIEQGHKKDFWGSLNLPDEHDDIPKSRPVSVDIQRTLF